MVNIFGKGRLHAAFNFAPFSILAGFFGVMWFYDQTRYSYHRYSWRANSSHHGGVSYDGDAAA